MRLQVLGGGWLFALNDEVSWELRESDPDWLLPAPSIGVNLAKGERDVWVEVHNARMDAQPGMLAALLSAACPAAHGCVALHLRLCGFTPAIFEGCSAHLAATTQLTLVNCFGTDVDATMAPALGALVQQTPQLRDLCVIGSSRNPRHASLTTGAPPAAAALQHVTSLKLAGLRLPRMNGVLACMPGA